ncbi:hypothetical protein NFI96_002360 [Prochilodus magdalenae]|nr:hypothetical protein NFI96_002360 [Prochilodus magdalenae]
MKNILSISVHRSPSLQARPDIVLDLDSDSDPEESSEEESSVNGDSEDRIKGGRRSSVNSRDSLSVPDPDALASLERNLDQRYLKAQDFRSLSCPRSPEEGHGSMVDKLLEKYGSFIPHHDPRLYVDAAAHTKSVPNYSILAFPDFWGHLPPQGPEPMAARKPHVQRKKVFEDVQRLLCPEDIINKAVFDIEDVRCLPENEVLARDRGVSQRPRCLPENEVFARERGVRQRTRCSPEKEVFARERGVRQRTRCSPENEVFNRERGVQQRMRCLPENEVFAREGGVHQRTRCSPENEVFARERGVRQKMRCSPEKEVFARERGVCQRMRCSTENEVFNRE